MLKELNLSSNRLEWSEKERLQSLSVLSSQCPRLKRLYLNDNPFLKSSEFAMTSGGYPHWRETVTSSLMNIQILDGIQISTKVTRLHSV